MAKAITAPQRAYLAAFDRWLRSWPGPEREKAQEDMAGLLALMRLDVADQRERERRDPERPVSPAHSHRSRRAAHIRWHENRRMSAPGCPFCEAD